jgi:hypothetical protein
MKTKILTIIIFLFPLIATAEGLSFKTFSKNIYDDVFGLILGTIYTLIVLFFAYSVLMFMLNSEKIDKSEKKSGSKTSLVWSIIALFIASSI